MQLDGAALSALLSSLEIDAGELADATEEAYAGDYDTQVPEPDDRSI